MNNIDRQYKELLDHILHFGVDKQDRTGTGTKSVFGWQIRHNMKEGFPVLTTKKMAWKSIVTELLWFLRGDTNIKFLHDNNCHIWDGDYEKSGRTNGELGPIYGKQWRNWGGWVETKLTQEKDENGYLLYKFIPHKGVDQIQNLINELKTNPDSRRLMVSAWNVGELDQMVLPPCHYGFQVYTRVLSLEERMDLSREKRRVYWDWQNWSLEDMEWKMNNEWNTPTRAISLMWNQRSVDTFLGLPFNIASYALLLEILAKAVNMVPEELIGNLGDTHLYLNHIEQAKEQCLRNPYKLPKLIMNPIFLANLEHKGLDEAVNGQVNFELENYQSHPAIKAPLSN
jgi:thymidylate synthase